MAPRREWFEKDYYATLGISKEASAKEVTKAYRKLARSLHPDANPGDADAEARFKEVSAAYDVIGDEDMRREYDKVRAIAPTASKAQLSSPTPPPSRQRYRGSRSMQQSRRPTPPSRQRYRGSRSMQRSRRPAPPSPSSIHRYSPRTRLLAGILAVVMLGGVVTVGIASLADRGGGGDNGTVVPNPCPAPDKSDGPRYRFTARPVYCLTSGVTYTAVFDTSEGEIRFTLDRTGMPETTNNFVALARYGYYDNTLLFRIDPSIGIIQGGAPTTNDWSDPGPGYTIPDEGGTFHRLANEGVSGPFSYESGQLVMARSAGLNSSGAQFFFTTTESVSLLDSQGSYLLFGATDNAGQSVLDAMMDLYVVDPESPYGGGPSHEIVIHSVTIVEG